MIKYNMFPRFMWIFLGRPSAKYMAKSRNLPVSQVSSQLNTQFRNILSRTEDIPSSPLRFNLIWGCLVFSLPKLFNDITDQEFAHCLGFQFRNPMQLKAVRKKKNVFKRDKETLGEENYSSPLTYDWEYTTDVSLFPKEVRRTYSKCGIHTLAKQENTLRFLPMCCKLDYVMYSGYGTELVRTQVLANGSDCCCFRFINSQGQSVSDLLQEEGISKEDLV